MTSAHDYAQLGIPTANIPPDGLDVHPDLQTGVYYGVVSLDPAKFTYSEGDSNGGTDRTDATEDAAAKKKATTVLPAVLSIGYNPFYKNTVRSVVWTGPFLSIESLSASFFPIYLSLDYDYESFSATLHFLT